MFTYTNRKGVQYFLCQGKTKTGRPRRYFAREPRDTPLARIPPGFTVSESPNGVVSLVKKRASPFLPLEVQALKASIRRHTAATDYLVQVRPRYLEVYERNGPGQDEISELARLLGRPDSARLHAELTRNSPFTPMLRFSLHDPAERLFIAERQFYLGRGGWILILVPAPLQQLLAETIPALGTEEFFELL